MQFVLMVSGISNKNWLDNLAGNRWLGGPEAWVGVETTCHVMCCLTAVVSGVSLMVCVVIPVQAADWTGGGALAG